MICYWCHGKGVTAQCCATCRGSGQLPAHRNDAAAPVLAPEEVFEEYRTDQGELGKPTVTAEGFKTFEAFVAQPGILQYRLPDGGTRRELVPPEVLHNAASLATLKRKPVTHEHPPDGKVTPENAKALSVGDVGSEIEIVEGGRVRALLTVRDRDALDAIARGDVPEVSPGYAVKVDNTPGVDAIFGAYDAIQTHRSYNHIALTAAGRGGPAIRLRADSKRKKIPMTPEQIAALVTALMSVGMSRADAADTAKVATDAAAKTAADAATIKRLEDALAGAVKGRADAEAALAAMKKGDAEAAEAIEEEPVDEEPVVEDVKADSHDRRIAWMRDRAKLEGAARRIRLDSEDAIAKLDNDALRKAIVRKAIVRKVNPDAPAKASKDYFRAAFDTLEMRTDDDRAGAYLALGSDGTRIAREGTREDGKDSDPSADGWLVTINKQFDARRA